MSVAVSLCKSAANKVVEKLTSLLKERYTLYLSFEDDLKKLQSDLSAISAVLHDAAEKPTTTTQSHSVQDWLGKLHDTLHDAEDVLDDINAEALRQKVVAEWRFVTLVRNLLFLSGIDARIKDIRGRIDDIAKQRNSFRLQEPDRDRDVVFTRRRREQARFAEVVGREGDQKEVVERLFGGGEGVFAVPVVGIGGLGKTALVDLIFDDDRVKMGFDFRVWVDVCDDLNPERIGQKRITRAVDCRDENVPAMDLLSSLEYKLRGKKFLLVIDDVWNCNRVDWLVLKKLLGNGDRGSRILVTTRYKITASIMGENRGLYELGGLADGDCWCLFEKWAFGEGESACHPNLARIGQEIVMKCGGVPLAIRTLGGLLSGSKEESYWLSVRNSDTWGIGHIAESEDGILSVLKLSYDQLPLGLKECFAYCCLLPKGREFDKQDLIHLWMAQSFIHSPDQSDQQQLEDIGSWYVNELVSRSIFDVVRENHKGEIVECRMHDLLHDLAKSVAESLMASSGTTANNTRHLSLWDTEVPTSYLNLPKLRTLVLHTKCSESELHALLSGSTYLRVLDLSNSGLKHVPSCIGNMKHLRYLNLSGNPDLQSLPDSICGLHFLQTLKLSGCRRISTFPRNFSHLVSLRHLVITTPYVWEKQLGTLTSLRWLTIENCRNLLSLTEVTQHLVALRTLRIHNCSKLTSLPSSLKNCIALEDLEVVNCPKMESLEICMQGLSSFRSLTIKGLHKLTTLPMKLEFYASSLQYLIIIDCLSLMKLPDCVGNLSSLMRVHIRYCPNLQNLPHGFSHLSALQVLKIDGCPLLSTRCRRNVGQDWQQIAHVREIYLDSVKI